MGVEEKVNKSTCILVLFGMLILLLIQSITPPLMATTIYQVPQNIQYGDIILIQWGDRDNLSQDIWFHKFLYWNHAFLYVGGEDNNVIHTWDVTRNESWNNAISRQEDPYGGVAKLGLARATTDATERRLAIQFAEDKLGHPYDTMSQAVANPRKQIQPDVEGWWYDVLPSTWVSRFCYNDSGRAWNYYCTELTWAAYFNATAGDKYLEYTSDKYALRGMEIWLDDDVTHINPTPYNVGNPQPMLYDEC
jgi:hypothetical protein